MLKSREFLSGKSRGRVGGGSTSTFSVILRRYSLLEVPGRRIHNVIAKAMSICVAFGNKVMDTRLPQPAGCGDKYDVYDWCLRRGFSVFSQSGRSMIEMLGVLAIIGVLSVGGIAGYSKAMEMYKMDKALEEYNFLIQGLMEHTEQLTKMSNQDTQMTSIADFVTAANLVPANWKKVGRWDFSDSVGNVTSTYLRNGHWAVEISIGGGFQTSEDGSQINASFSTRACEALFRDLVQPLHSPIHHAFLFRWKQGSITFYGDKNCADGKKCLRNLTVAEINQTCKACQKDQERCSIGMEFE